MSKEFKPGDLAMTIGLGRSSGKAVELIEHLGAPDWVSVQGQELHNNNRDDVWLVRVLGEPMRPSKSLAELLGILPMTEVPIPTRCLMPLRGDENPDATLVTDKPRELDHA